MTPSAVPAHEVDVVLARPTATSVTFSVLATADVEATLAWEPGHGSRALSLKSGTPLEVEIAGLEANRPYKYTLISGKGPLASGGFRTARAIGAPFRFVLQADSHLDANTEPAVYLNTLANMVADEPDFLVDLGDTFMTDKFKEPEDSTSQYLAQRYYLGRVGAAMPVFLALGNHDGQAGWVDRNHAGMTEWARAMRARYFPPVRTSAFYSAGPADHAYYAWTWGDALFIVLDPFTPTRNRPTPDGDGWAWTLGADQYNWLDRTLVTSRAKHRFVFIHHLVGGSPGSRAQEARGGAEASRYFEWGGANADGTPGFATHRPGFRMPIHDLLKSHGVSAVFHGHDHLYAHQERDGIAYQEVPQPGHRADNARHSGDEYGYASGTILGSSGHLRVSIEPTAATVEFVRSRLAPPKAEVVDRYTLKGKETSR